MEKFQEIDIKLMGDPINNKDSKHSNLNIEINNQNNNNAILNVPSIPPKIQTEPQCIITFF